MLPLTCTLNFNPLLPNLSQRERLAKILILIQGGSSKKFPMSVATMSR